MAVVDRTLQMRPWWWHGVERHAGPEADPPAHVDVAVIGIGFTGAAAALTLAKRGRQVLLLDARDPGDGASSRNLGMASEDLGLPFSQLVQRVGPERAAAMTAEGTQALDHLERLIGDGIACDYRRTGRVQLAYAAQHLAEMRDDLAALQAAQGTVPARLLDRAGLKAEVASDLYSGGVLWERGGGLDPSKLMNGLFDRARQAGALIAARCGVLGLRDTGDGFHIDTEIGGVKATSVVLATNAYTGTPIPPLQRRQVYVGGQAIATQPLGRAMVGQLIPGGRMCFDSRNRARFFRPSPDGERLLFAGSPRILLETRQDCIEMLGDWMTEIFPTLAATRITHAWQGNVGLSFDRVPHIGQLGSLYFAAGYGWSGIAMAVWLGHKLALKLLADPAAPSAFDSTRMPTLPFYQGTAWFLPPMQAWAAFKDRRAKRAA